MSADIVKKIKRNETGFYFPNTEDEVVALIKYANEIGGKIRVRGSEHSPRISIYTDNFYWDEINKAEKEINVNLDYYSRIRSIDRSKMQITVQSGIHLDEDPNSLTELATHENSLVSHLSELGWALDDLGGITHQSVSGFISTGSSGGTAQYSFSDNIVKLRIISGKGEIIECSRTENEDLFYASVVSVGLFGIISEVTLQCIPHYDIIGEESITKISECKVDLFDEVDDDRPSLPEFLEDTEYTRILWWPQKGVRRAVVWQARRMKESDYTQETNPPDGPGKSPFKPDPYEEVGDFPKIANFFAGVFYWIIGNTNRLWILGKLIQRFMGVILPFVLKVFIPLDKNNKGDQKGKPQRFWDSWWHGLPMDNQMSDTMMPTVFTEIWIPMEKATDAIRKLRNHYNKNGLSATGTYACEIYAGRQNNIWLSPGYKQTSVRFNIFWFAKNANKPVLTFYPQFWALLKEFDYRLHWGKFIPSSLSDTGPEYLKKQYPKFDEFMKIRKEMDPNDIFLTSYWKRHLGI